MENLKEVYVALEVLYREDIHDRLKSIIIHTIAALMFIGMIAYETGKLVRESYPAALDKITEYKDKFGSYFIYEEEKKLA